MDALPEPLRSFGPFAALAILFAAFAWFSVGKEAIRLSEQREAPRLYGKLAAASYVTAAAFVLAFIAWFWR
jgi:hypothetical protein